MPLPPIVSSCLLALAIGCTSNLIAQKLQAYNAGKPFVFDNVLFYHFAILSVITTPINYYWQIWLERTFPGWKPAKGPHAIDVEKAMLRKDDGEDKRVKDKDALVRNWRNIFYKWFSDCITFGALLNTAMFLILMGLMEGKTYAQIEENLRTDMWGIIWDSYKVWPIANLISIMYVPVEKRIVFLSFCGMAWNVYMSLVAARL